MTSPTGKSPPASQPASPQPTGSQPLEPGRPGERLSIPLVAVVLVVLSAVVVFAAGLSLGGQSVGRDSDEQAAIEAFTQTYRRITDEFVGGSEPGELLEGAIEGMFGTLEDPYSAYMGAEEFEAAFEGINGEFEGVGARMNAEDAEGLSCELIGDGCELRVVEVLPDTPARSAGLEDDDIVTAVDGRSLEGRTIDDVVMLIRGPRGSDVTLALERADREMELVITRDVIVSQDVRSAALSEGRIGYLRIDGFSSRVAEDFESALRGHLDAGRTRLIVDVRDDPGGFVDAAVEITSEFLGDGAVFWEEDADGDQRSIDVSPGGLATDTEIQLVVLVDDGTASASEILAGALQDAGRAALVGQRTFGKGTVQEWTQLPGENGGFRLSIARWLTRDKSSIHHVGLEPDVEVTGEGLRFRPSGDEQDKDEIASDLQLQRAISLLLGEEAAIAGSSPPPSAAPAVASPST